MDSLHHARQIALEGICTSLSEGATPWCSDRALMGPPVLSRSGAVVRGLEALVLWHASENLDEPTLVWELFSSSAVLSPFTGPVLELPANGGVALYPARPLHRSIRVTDPPPRQEQEVRTRATLKERLKGILKSLGAAAPDLSQELLVIADLASAFLRPLGDPWVEDPVSWDKKPGP